MYDLLAGKFVSLNLQVKLVLGNKLKRKKYYFTMYLISSARTSGRFYKYTENKAVDMTL
jgi:hypothetical protein